VVGIYASNPEYGRASGEYDPEHVRPEQIEAELREDSTTGGVQILLAPDDQNQGVGLGSVLPEHPRYGDPWIGLLIVHGDQHGSGYGRLLAAAIEDRLRSEGRKGIGLAVLDNNPTALAFWSALGWQEIDRRPDAQYGRPCIVMHKPLT